MSRVPHIPMPRPIRRRHLALLATAVGVLAPLLAGAGMPTQAALVPTGPVPICFPVLDRVTYRDDFGDSRGGGTRSHEGNDLIGAKLHRLVATVDGVIADLRYSPGSDPLDNSLRIQGDDGYFYTYLHMNDDTPGTDDGMATYEQAFAPGIARGARVRAGQVIGYMGDSGNAESAGAHLHFEMRTALYSGAFSPYASLQAARRCQPINSPTHPFTALGGVISSDPDAASAAEGSLDVFARGSDNALYQRAWIGDEGRFTGWTSLGGISRSGPGVISPAADRIDVFIRGVDDALWTRTRTGSTWGEWRSLGGIVASDPDVATDGAGGMTVAIRGVDGALWVKQFDGTAWSEWTAGGGGLRSGPAVGSTSPGRLDVFARGLDDAMWHRSMLDGTWTPWETLGGIIDVDPDVAVEAGAIHIVVRGTDRRLYALPYSDGGTWTPVSIDPVGSAATITSWGNDRLDVFVAGTDTGLYQTWWNGTAW